MIGPPTTITAADGVTVLPVRGIGEVRAGDDVAVLVEDALAQSMLELRAWDVVVVTQKVVSKAEGRVVELATVRASEAACELAERTGVAADLIEVILGETAMVVRAEPAVLICETHSGQVTANAGVDRSNVASGVVSLLPRDADASARRLRTAWQGKVGGAPLGVVISDTFGRPFRLGIVNVAIGVAGLPALSDHRGGPDSSGRLLDATVVATADEIAAAAELVMGKTDGVPVVVVRGLRWMGEGEGVRPLLRERSQDIFRR